MRTLPAVNLRAVAWLALSILVASPLAAQEGSEGGSIGGSLAAPKPTSSSSSSSRSGERHYRTQTRAVPAATQPAPAPSRRASRAPRQEETSRERSHTERHGAPSFDGAWSVSAAGPCAAAGTAQVYITGGRLSGQGISGSVSPNGSVRTVGSINGLTVLSSGRISGQSASGSYRQSDGCSGTWHGIKL